MTLSEAIELLTPCNLDNEIPSVWTDLGCGNGLFTYALAALLAPASQVYAIDRQSEFVQRENNNTVDIRTYRANFVDDELPFSSVTGLLMANSLHYVKDKRAFISKMKKYLQTQGRWIIIEYDTDKPNAWVPYPISFENLQELFRQQGYRWVVKKSKRPSIYNAANMYCATVNQ